MDATLCLILAVAGVGFLVFGVILIVTREWSADFHERWNQKFNWTRWATGPKYMQASRVANVVCGIVFIVIGAILGMFAFAALFMH